MGVPNETELEQYAKHHNIDPEVVKEELKTSDELANTIIAEERDVKKEDV